MKMEKWIGMEIKQLFMISPHNKKSTIQRTKYL